MRSTAYFLAIVGLGMALGSSAHAQDGRKGDGQGRARPTFEQLDKNGDGKIVAGEVPAQVWQRLVHADTNKDNAVTKAEFEARSPMGRPGGKKPPSFEELDKNGDGKIVASEVPAQSWQHLSRLDTNKDNAVSKAEFEAGRANRDRGHKGHHTFEQLDKDGDGKLVQSEVPDRMWQWLLKLDSNKDNAITKTEFEARRQRGR